MSERESLRDGVPLVVAERVTFDAQREPMFVDERGTGWVPLTRFDELHDFLRRVVSICDACIERCNEAGKPPAWWSGTQIDPAKLRVLALQALGERE